jgi:hypothetical protein
MTRITLAAALVAVLMSGGALAAALHRPAPASPYPLVCAQPMHSAQTGITVRMYIPCSAVQP